MRTLHKAGLAATAVAVVALAVTPLIQDEGYAKTPYYDIVHKLTCCIGETEGCIVGHTSTLAECKSKLVKRATEDYYKPLAQCIPGFATQPLPLQAAGLRLSYNVGVGAVCGSSFARQVSAGQPRAACNAIMNFDKARTGPNRTLQVVKGLHLRRERERAQCLLGVPN